MGPGPIGGLPFVGVFLRDPSPHLREFRRKPLFFSETYAVNSANKSGFLRNSRKYGLGSLRKTPHGGHSTYRPRSLMRQSALTPTTNQPWFSHAWLHGAKKNASKVYYFFFLGEGKSKFLKKLVGEEMSGMFGG